MSSKQPGKLLRSAPYFPVSDVERSMHFYDQVLGFRCEYSAAVLQQFCDLQPRRARDHAAQGAGARANRPK